MDATPASGIARDNSTGPKISGLIKRLFAELTTRMLRRGVHRSVADLETDIRTWIDNWNRDPRPYIWTKTAEQILESIGAYCQQLLKLTNDSGH